MTTPVAIGELPPLGAGVRVVISDPELSYPHVVGMAGKIASVHEAGCFTLIFDTPIDGYVSMHLTPEQVDVSPYQGEPIVAVNNHD
jgi:hypothetical protein